MCASEYVQLLTQWVNAQLSDNALFPADGRTPYPPNFKHVVGLVCKRLFRVYAHLYHNHFRQVVEIGAEAHLNTCFKRFLFFVQEFELVALRELAPLKKLIQTLD